MRHRQVFSVVATGVTVAVGALTATAAHADDPLTQIKGAILRDRAKACHDVGEPGRSFGGGYSYDTRLEQWAQAYARSNAAPPTPPGYQSIKYFKGSGDPEAHAINSAYTRGVGNVVADCAIANFGVGFVRAGSTDFVTMVFGVPNPQPVPPKDPNARPPAILK